MGKLIKGIIKEMVEICPDCKGNVKDGCWRCYNGKIVSEDGMLLIEIIASNLRIPALNDDEIKTQSPFVISRIIEFIENNK